MKTTPLLIAILMGIIALAGCESRPGAATGSAAAPAKAPVSAKALRMVLIGDSTVCNYPDSDPRRGWGQFIQGYFNDGIKVINLAKSGRSTKTFLSEGLWQKALAKKPDYVLIQFGHNDSHNPSKPEATNAATDFKDNLRRYVDEARAAGAMPVLITPMCRRTYSSKGKLKNVLLPYANAMKAVAVEKSVPLVDLNMASFKYFEKIGRDATQETAAKAINRDATEETPAKADDTHFNEKGARAMAGLVMQELPVVEPSLQKYLK